MPSSGTHFGYTLRDTVSMGSKRQWTSPANRGRPQVDSMGYYLAKHIQAIEAIQRTFTYKITEEQHLNNRERLHELKLYSLQSLRERYIIICIWNITHHMVPNIPGTIEHKIKTRKHQRYGTQ